MNEQTLLPPKMASRDDSFQRAYVELASRLVEFGDLSDAAGRPDLSDKVASVGTRLSLLKLAQYEGFTNYWIANGRAFERAYKEKASKPGASPHEAWWAVLEEYQESLPGNQSKFNEKYAAVNLNGEAATHLAEVIVDRVEQHGSPSVAFYQAIHDISTGNTVLAVADELSSILDEARGDEKLGKAVSELESSVSSAIRTAGITDWLGRGVNWLGKAFDPIAEGVERFEMGAMGAGGPIVNVAVKIRQQFEKIKEVVRYMRTGDPNTTASKDFAKSFLIPIKKEINQFSSLAKAAGISVPNYEQVVSYLDNGSELNAGNVENFFPVMSAVYRLTENQPLLEKMYKAYLRRQKAIKVKHQRDRAPATRVPAAPEAAPGTATAPEAPASPAAAPVPAMSEVGPEFVGNFMGAIENAKKLSPKQYNLLRSLLNRILMRQKQIGAPQIVRQPGIAAESNWSIKTAAVSMDDLLEEVLNAYERISGKPLLTPEAINVVKKNLGSPSTPAAPVSPAAPASPAPTGTATPAPGAPTTTTPAGTSVPTPGASGKAVPTRLTPEQQQAKEELVQFAIKWLASIPENDPSLKQLQEGLRSRPANNSILVAIMDLRANDPRRAKDVLSRLALINQLAIAGDNDARVQVIDEYKKPDKGVLTRMLASAIESSGIPAIGMKEAV